MTELEQHGDFLRDVCGDTVHASAIRLIDGSAPYNYMTMVSEWDFLGFLNPCGK